MKIKTKFIAALALAGSAFVAPANAAVTFTAGDLILAVRGAAEATTLMVNLGAATSYRDAVSDNNSIVNIGLDLGAFAGWQTRSDVTWALFGVRATNTLAGVVNGDPGQTIYISRAETPVGVQETAWGVAGQTISVTNHTNGATNMATVQNAFDVAEGTVNLPNQAAFMPDTASPNDYESLGTTWAAFTIAPGTKGNFGSGTAGTALDLFRSLGTTTGASPSGTARVGSYEGTFRIDDSGVVSYSTTPSPVPEPSRAVLLGLGAVGFIFRRRRTPAQA